MSTHSTSQDPGPAVTQNIAAVPGATRLTWRYWLYFILLGFILLSDGADVTLIGQVIPPIIAEWGVEIGGAVALVVALGYIAQAIGAFIAGWVADRTGRKAVLTVATLVMSVATALGATSQDFTVFTVWRLIACLGMGAVMALAISFVADLTPARWRSTFVTAAYAFVGLGVSVLSLVAGVVLPVGGWRALLLVAGAFPFVLIILVALIVPESPAFYLGRGQVEKARKALARLAPDAELESLEVPAVVPKERQRDAVAAIFSKRYALSTVLLIVFGFLSLGAQLLFVQYLPTLLQLPDPGLSVQESSAIVALYGLGSVVGGIVLSLVLAGKRVSRFWVIGTWLAIAGVALLFVGILPLDTFGTLIVALPILGLIFPSIAGSSRQVLAAGTYPTQVRASGVGATELGGRLGSAAGGGIGGGLIGAGLGLGGFALALLAPVAVLVLLVLGLAAAARRLPQS